MIKSLINSFILSLIVIFSANANSLYTPITGNAAYKLVFDEEFNGTSIDTAKWQVTFDGNPDNTYGTYNNAQFWLSTNAKVANGVLNLSVTQCPAGYCTAAITTWKLQKYGYWEARIKAPASAKGIGFGIWTDAKDWVFPEIDIFEASGSRSNEYMSNWHDGNIWASSNTITGFDPTKWHVVSMWWTSTAIVFYIDGVHKKTIYTQGRGAVPQWTLLHATVGPWGDLVDGSTVFPATFKIDYVHIYSNASNAVAVTPQPGYGGPGYHPCNC